MAKRTNLPKKICPEIQALTWYRRRVLGWSQADWADELDLATQSVGGWERGTDCRLSVLKKYAAGLGLEVIIQFVDKENGNGIFQAPESEGQVPK